MGRTLLGTGRIGEPLRSQVLAAQPIILAEELTGSYVLRMPGEYTMNPTRGAVALCPNRFVVWSRRSKTIDVPLTPAWLSRLTVAADRPNRFVVTTGIGRHAGAPIGTLSIRLRTTHAHRLVALLSDAGAPGPPAPG